MIAGLDGPSSLILDVHVHPWTREFMKKNGPIMKACDFFKLDLANLPTSTGQLIDEMDDAGVDRAVILGQDTSSSKNPAFRNYTIKNDEIAKIAELEDLGVEVKDLDFGLVDFPAERYGECVVLCWRYGEADVSFWHKPNEGYNGRKSLKIQLIQP